MALSTWAKTQLSHLLPLDQESLNEIIDYTSALPKDAAAEHLKNLLGDSPKALEFISSFNARRDAPNRATPTQITASAPPETARKSRKKKNPLNKLPPPRRPEDYGNTLGAYQKKEEQDYMGGSRRHRPEPVLAKSLALSHQPDARQLPKAVPAISTPAAKPPPSASGHLISDLPNVRSGSRTSSRTSSPAPKTKINVAGGTSMHGASTTLQDLVSPLLPFHMSSIDHFQDSAIRTLELQTNPSLSADPSSRRCTCLATRHPLLAAAPNCLNCGKIVCVKEGIGPCTFCGHPLLSSHEISAMIESLRQERGQEKMNLNNASQRRPDLASNSRPFTNPSTGTSTPSSSSAAADKSLDLAKEHRDKLLAYQAENARRTHIIDEAADFETPTSGLSMWSSPVERAAQLKRQQKVLREQEWNAKPEYEKRRVVVSVDLVGGKVVRRMGDVERPRTDGGNKLGEEVIADGGDAHAAGNSDGGGTFSRNPLLGSLIRPVWKGKDKASEMEEDSKENRPRESAWRRVQDDNDDNEAWILDGGVYGSRDDERRLGDEEHAQG